MHFTAVALPGTARSRELAVRLARGYTSDYRVDAEINGAEIVQPVRNVLHALALEGAAIVVEEDDKAADVEFLRNYIANVVAPVYVPLAITALHELHFLLRLKQSTARYVRFDRPDATLHAGLARRRDELLSFRLYYRFSHASLISTHNAVYLAWRRALDLDRILAEVTQDVVEVERHLGVAIQQGVERRLGLISRMGAAGIAFVATVPISERLLSAGLTLGERMAGIVGSESVKEPWWLGIAAIGLGIAAASLAWYKAGRLKAHQNASHLHHLIEEPRKTRRG